MLDELLHRVSNHTPRTLETDKRFPEAAVLVPITRSDEPELVLTLRASGLDPWRRSGVSRRPPRP